MNNSHRSRPAWRARVLGMVGALLAASAVTVLAAPATPALADTGEPTLIPYRNASDPEIQPCPDQSGGTGLCLFTSNDLGTHGPSFDWYYPMEQTYLYTLEAGQDPSNPTNWQDRGAVFSESQLPWVGRYSDNTLAQHLWAPTHFAWQGYQYLLVPDITATSQPSTSSRIAVARSSSLTSGYSYETYYNINGYASDPAVFIEPHRNSPYLVYADGDNSNCGGVSIAPLQFANPTLLDGAPTPITINGLATAFGAVGPCAQLGRPYLEGPSLYWFDNTTTGGSAAGGGQYYLIFATKPEGGFHGASNEVIAYATSTTVNGPYTYQGIIMDASSTEWTNQASIAPFGDHYVFAYHDGTPSGGLPARRAHASCLSFMGGSIGSISRSPNGFAQCIHTRGTIALRSRGNGKVVSAENYGDGFVTADRDHIQTWEKFDVVPRAGGRFALQAEANGLFVSANHTIGQLKADATSIGPAEEFSFAFNDDGSVSVRDGRSISYPMFQPDRDGVLLNGDARGVQPTYGFKFDVVSLSNPFNLRAQANGMIVTAGSGGTGQLIASSSINGPGTQFQPVNLPDSYLSLRSVVSAKYVCAENAGADPLIANRDGPLVGPGSWEEFVPIWNSDGTFSFQARINQKYVTAENAGGSPLIANRDSIFQGPGVSWEKFDLIAV